MSTASVQTHDMFKTALLLAGFNLVYPNVLLVMIHKTYICNGWHSSAVAGLTYACMLLINYQNMHLQSFGEYPVHEGRLAVRFTCPASADFPVCVCSAANHNPPS